MGFGRPVVSSPPRDRRVPGLGTPHHRSVSLSSGGGATPATRTRDLPASLSLGGGGPSRMVSLNGSMSSPYAKTSSVYYPPEGEEEEEEADEATRRNTLANTNPGADVLPIPPPPFQKKRW